MSMLYKSGQKVEHVNIIHKWFILVVKNVKNRCIVTLNNSGFIDFFDRIYFLELELTDTTNTARSTS
jgi:hypothetical protein